MCEVPFVLYTVNVISIKTSTALTGTEQTRRHDVAQFNSILFFVMLLKMEMIKNGHSFEERVRFKVFLDHFAL